MLKRQMEAAQMEAAQMEAAQGAVGRDSGSLERFEGF